MNINKKSKIISVVGSGGKTTLVYKLANSYALQGKKVLITTTTHMTNDGFYYDIDEAIRKENNKSKNKSGIICKVGSNLGDKVGTLSKEELDKARRVFDIIIVEADGSRCMPVKIPNLEKEPVILEGTDEIYIVSGLAAIGRKLRLTCQRFNILSKEDRKEIENKFCKSGESIDDLIVTKELLEYILNKFYVVPLSKKYNVKTINIYFADMKEGKIYKNYNKIAFVMLASGLSKRFTKSCKEYIPHILKEGAVDIDGQSVRLSNKLLDLAKFINEKIQNIDFINKLTLYYKGSSVYEHLLNELIISREQLIKLFKKECNHNIKINIGIATRYKKIILESRKIYKEVDIIDNNHPEDGISASIKEAVKFYKNYDAIVFFNSDYVNLKSTEIVNFVYYCALSNNLKGMMCNEELEAVTPAFASSKFFDEILKISGDRGAGKIIGKQPCYLYHIDDNSVKDIDDIKDILL